MPKLRPNNLRKVIFLLIGVVLGTGLAAAIVGLIVFDFTRNFGISGISAFISFIILYLIIERSLSIGANLAQLSGISLLDIFRFWGDSNSRRLLNQLQSNNQYLYISAKRLGDRKHVLDLNLTLQQLGFPTWLDERLVTSSLDFSADLERRLESASHLLLCILAEDTFSDLMILRELGYAVARGIPVVILLFAECKQLDSYDFRTVDFRISERESSLDELITLLLSEPVGLKREYSNVHRRVQGYLIRLYEQIIIFIESTVFSFVQLKTKTIPLAVNSRSSNALPHGFVGLPLKSQSPVEAVPIQFDSFDAAFQFFHFRALLLGDPGSGKTTTLMTYARDITARRLIHDTYPIPVVVPISSWQAEIDQPILEWLASVIDFLDITDLNREIQASNVIFLFDGLDELGEIRHRKAKRTLKDVEGNEYEEEVEEPFDPRLAFVNQVNDFCKKHKVLITCRVKDYSDIGAKLELDGAISLVPLDDIQLQNYLNDLPTLWKALSADKALLDFFRTPLLARLLRFAYIELSSEITEFVLDEPTQGEIRDKLFKIYVTKRLEHETMRHEIEPGFPLEQVIPKLEYVALADASAQSSANVIDIYKLPILFSEDKELTNDIEYWKSLFVQAERLHFLVRIGPNTWKFVHLLLRDYFAFQIALRLISKKESQSDLFVIEAINALGNIGDSRGVAPLVNLLSSSHESYYDEISWALARIGDPSVITEMLNIFSIVKKTEALYEMSGAISSLLKIATKEIIDMKVANSLLQSTNRDIREYATEFLGVICDLSSIEPLIRTLFDSEPSVRSGATMALTNFEVSIVGKLVAALGGINSDDNDVLSTLYRLAQKDIQPLLEAINDVDAEVRKKVIRVLSTVDRREGWKVIGQTMYKDDNVIVRMEAAVAFAQNDQKQAENVLISYAEDQQISLQFRLYAVKCLEDIGYDIEQLDDGILYAFEQNLEVSDELFEEIEDWDDDLSETDFDGPNEEWGNYDVFLEDEDEDEDEDEEY